ncbi:MULTISPECIES: hypothetical protein [Streptacidiphilus]|uniref:Uncharacterized protein n=1 Tax=Streptacidiphilus cavernicola TaxID=3342716 RepID=A0ABV6V085_9ACTN|nr:hypothetical protein [Streptacidiphilus jeojiense]
MSGRISASRSAALKAAQEAKGRRDALRLAHEQMVESALADWFEGTTRAEELRARAQAKAAQILADAEAAAAQPEAAARRALRMLVGLGEPRDQIAALTGLTLSDVRGALATAEAESERNPVTARVANEASEPLEAATGTGPAVVAVVDGAAVAAGAATDPP